MSILKSSGKYEYLTDHDPKLLELALKLHRERPDLQKAFPDVDSPGFLRWLNVDAYMAYDYVREFYPDIPPIEGMNVTSAGGVGGFLEGGFESFHMIHSAARRQGKALRSFDRVLDFGCGFGRTLRYWPAHADHVELHGCDVNREGVEWCKGALDFAKFETTSPHPRLPYADGMFDLIWANSIFSHLEENNHKEWLEELARISRENALLILTTHGPESLGMVLSDADRCANVGLTPAQAQGAKLRLDKTGYAFCRQPGMTNPDLYGMTFITPEYVKENWTREFDVVEHEPLGLQGWQDFVVVKPRPMRLRRA